jgi:NADH dehydrogenase FAD-containing subunit
LAHDWRVARTEVDGLGNDLLDTHRGLKVTITEVAPELMTTVDLDLGAPVAAEIRRQGVEVVTQQAISSVVQDGKALVLEAC